MRIFPTVLLLSLMFVVGSDLHAQEVSSSDLEHELRMMVAGPAPADEHRELVRNFLSRPEVQEVVAQAGLDMERLEARLGTLDDEALADLATRVHDFDGEGDLVGGNTIVISGSTLIIILLLLIIVT